MSQAIGYQPSLERIAEMKQQIKEETIRQMLQHSPETKYSKLEGNPRIIKFTRSSRGLLIDLNTD